MKLSEVKNAYFVGIKGVGMTAFAQILKERGVAVSGSDTTELFFTDEVLKHLGIAYTEGFDAARVPQSADVVVTSPAYINSDNPEIAEVQKRGLQLITWHDGMAELFNAGFGVAVCGTHGKSTTTAMLGTILEVADKDPTVVVGSRVNAWNSNARVGASDLFVIEADEYRDAFLHYEPKMILVTNIEYDHPDYFPTAESYAMSFKEFMDRVPQERLIRTPVELRRFNLKVPGEHNQRNANLAFDAALALGVDEQTAQRAIESFAGLARRFEHYGSAASGAVLYDDYAHHPTELKALVQAAREHFPRKRIVLLFQPHTFSRTQRLFTEFCDGLDDADEVAILRTYSSAREEGEDTIGKKLAQSLKAPYFATHQEAVEHFSRSLSANDVLFAVGAGDGWRVLKQLRSK